jgi:hypothetical protein
MQGIDPKLHQSPAVIYSVGLLLLGAQIFSIGFIAELITAFQGRAADTYSIAEQTPPSVVHRSTTTDQPATHV